MNDLAIEIGDPVAVRAPADLSQDRRVGRASSDQTLRTHGTTAAGTATVARRSTTGTG